MSQTGKKSVVKKSGVMMRHRKVLRDNLHGITKSDIRRCARRGGVKRISSDVYPEIRTVLKSFLQRIVLTATTYAEYARRKTVNVSDIIHALKREGRPLYGFDPEPSRQINRPVFSRSRSSVPTTANATTAASQNMTAPQNTTANATTAASQNMTASQYWHENMVNNPTAPVTIVLDYKSQSKTPVRERIVSRKESQK